MSLSQDALDMLQSTELSGGTVEKYVLCNLYDFQDNSIGNITSYVENASWSKSRQFGVDILNITLVNEDDVFLSGGSFALEQDQKIVLVEGYETGNAEDRIPTFKGFIKEIRNDNSKKYNITVYGKLLLLQRSDLNTIFEADFTTVENEELVPYITDIISTVDSVSGNRVRFKYNLNNIALEILAEGQYLYIETFKYKINGLPITPNNLPKDGDITYVFYDSISGSFTPGEALISESGNFTGNYISATTWNSENVIAVSSASGYLGDGEKLYNGTDIIIVNSFYDIILQSDLNINRTPADDGILSGNRVHDGLIRNYKSEFPNWSSFRTHDIKYTQITGGTNTNDPFDGFEVNEEKGIVRFNQPQPLDNYVINATYSYYPKGLLVEDVMRDLIITEDSLQVDIVENGTFVLGDYSWINDISGLTNYTINKDNEVLIYSNEDMTSGEYLGIKQDIDLLSGYTYTISIDTLQQEGISGLFRIYLDNDIIYSATDFKTWTNQSVTYSCTSSSTYTLSYRIYDLNTSDTIKMNNAKVTYNPNIVNSLSKTNLYCKRSIELGNTNQYSLTNSSLSYIITPKYNYLKEEIISSNTTIEIHDSSEFEASGIVQIGNEMISYTSISGTYLTGITRGFNSTIQSNHLPGTRVYEVLPTSRIWYLDLNNIIPNTENTTASDYGYTGSVDLSASNFTISGATFDTIYYREGIVITDVSATSVILNSGTDYLFNQLQSTGIEMPFILIDYKKIQTRYDALEEIKTKIAPNYVIREIVRKDGSDYISYIKGNYIFQKTTEDYEINCTTGINRITPDKNYNRVKMFGKLLNPKNIMYEPNVTAFSTNDLNIEFIRGMEYKFQRRSGDWYVFSNEFEYIIDRVKDKDLDYVHRQRILSGSNVKKQGNIYSIGVSPISTYPHSYDLALCNNNTLTVGIDSYAYSLGYQTGFDATNFIVYNCYTPYYIKYNGNSEFSIEDEITNSGTGIGTIGYIQDVVTNDTIDKILFVNHDTGTPTFTTLQTIDNGTASATVSLIDINNNSNTANFNDTNISKIDSWYNVTFNDFNPTVDINYIESSDTKIYIDNWQISQNDPTAGWGTPPRTEIGTAEDAGKQAYVDVGLFGLGGKEVRGYRRKIDTTGMYINKNYDEYFDNKDMILNGINPVGTVLFRKFNTDYTVDPNYDLLLSYKGQPGVDNVELGWNDRNSKLSQLLLDRNEIFYMKQNGNISPYRGNLGKIIQKCTHVYYYTRTGGEIQYKFINGELYLNKKQFDEYGYSTDGSNKIKVDGKFQIEINDEYENENLPLITRLRNNTVKSRDYQISIVSQSKVEDFPLFIVDLGEVRRIKYIDVQGGFIYLPTDDNGSYGCNFNFTLKYSDKNISFDNLLDSDFVDISDKTIGLNISEGQTVSLEEGELGEYFQARYLKLFIDTSKEVSVEIETDKTNTKWYGGAISSIAVYEDDVIVSEKYVNSNVINLYKDTTVYEELYTQELLDTYTQANLDEFQKDGNTINVGAVAGVHYEVGQTLRLNDIENNINDLHFVEEISSNNGNVTLTLANYN